jgi:hypothetical protein
LSTKGLSNRVYVFEDAFSTSVCLQNHNVVKWRKCIFREFKKLKTGCLNVKDGTFILET